MRFRRICSNQTQLQRSVSVKGTKSPNWSGSMNTNEILAHLISEPFSTYRAKSKDNLTSHQLGDFKNTPLLHFKKKCGLCKDEVRPAFLIGRACHTLTL